MKTRQEIEDVFVPRRGLRGSHLQTLAGNFLPRRNLLPPAQERLFVVDKIRATTGQLVQEARVLCHCHWQSNRQEALTLIIVHGLEGSSASQYVIGTGGKAWHEGWNVVRMNMRTCGGTEALTPTLYHSGLSADVGAIAKTLIAEDALQKIVFVGYSMGGNLVMRLAGEWGSHVPKQCMAFAGVSPAMDLAPSADSLHDPANRLYEWRFVRGLMRRYRRKRRLFPGVYEDTKLRGRFPSIREFDDKITARYSGFNSADDYYSRASASQLVQNIAVPTLVIHSQDDPFIRLLAQTREKLLHNPHITLLETKHGGHCAFIAEANGYDGRWAEKTVIQFFRQFAS